MAERIIRTSRTAGGDLVARVYDGIQATEEAAKAKIELDTSMRDAATVAAVKARTGMTQVLKTVLEEMAEMMGKEVAALGRRLASLESRMADLTQTKTEYVGVWKKDALYRKGHFVSHRGLWHADQASQGVEPGSDPVIWTLAVKSGR